MSGIYLDTDEAIYCTISSGNKIHLQEIFLDPFVSYSDIKKSKIVSLDSSDKDDIDPRLD